MNIIMIDWGKDASKRSAYRAELSTRRISRLPFNGSLSHLVEYASSLKPPVLIGIDAAIGFPYASWERLNETHPFRSNNFIDFLLSTFVSPPTFSTLSRNQRIGHQSARSFVHPQVLGH